MTARKRCGITPKCSLRLPRGSVAVQNRESRISCPNEAHSLSAICKRKCIHSIIRYLQPINNIRSTVNLILSSESHKIISSYLLYVVITISYQHQRQSFCYSSKELNQTDCQKHSEKTNLEVHESD